MPITRSPWPRAIRCNGRVMLQVPNCRNGGIGQPAGLPESDLKETLTMDAHHPGFAVIEWLTVIRNSGLQSGLLMPAVPLAREAARRVPRQIPMKQFGLPLKNSHGHHKQVLSMTSDNLVAHRSDTGQLETAASKRRGDRENSRFRSPRLGTNPHKSDLTSIVVLPIVRAMESWSTETRSMVDAAVFGAPTDCIAWTAQC